MTHPLELLKTQYDIVAKLREGGMGEIYQVKHRLLDELRIAKILRPQHQDDAEMSARFAQEARAAIQLRHPNIVQIFDFSVDPSGVGLIVMEYIRGVDLHRLIHRRPLSSIALTLEIARQSLRALGYLHQQGFIHRDVSPDNVMLSQDYEGHPLVKLIDLGIAKNLHSPDDLTTTGTFLGKFRYASPEHFTPGGAEAIDPRSDLYSFGLVLYELLTGSFPLDSESTSQLIAGHLYHPPRAFSVSDPEGRVPEELRTLTLRLLAKNLDGRFDHAGEAVNQLEELQEQYPAGEDVIQEAQMQVSSPPASTSSPTIQSTPPSLAAQEDPIAEEVYIPPAATAEDPSEGGDKTIDEPAVAALEYLLEAAREALGHGHLQSAEELLAGARQQIAPEIAPESTKGVQLEELGREIKERRKAQGEGLSRVVQELEGYLASGELMTADRALFQAAEVYGDHPALGAVRKRLDDIHHRGFEAEVRNFIERVKEMAARDDLNEALDLIAKAQALAAQDSSLMEELTTLGEDLEVRAEERRQRWVSSTRRAIEERLAANDLQGARDALNTAEARLGSSPQAYELRQVLNDSLRTELDQRRVASRAAAADGHFGEALARLREALTLSEGDPRIRQELQEAEANQARHEESQRHDPEWTHALAAIESAIESDGLKTAEEHLERAIELWGPGATFDRLGAQITELRRREINHLLRDAEKAREADDLLAARLLLVQVFELEPKNSNARRLSAALDQGAGAFEDVSPEIEETISTIRKIHTQGQRLAAWHAIQAAIERYGEAAPLAQLRREIAEEMMGDDSGN